MQARSGLCNDKTVCVTTNSELQVKSIQQAKPAGLLQEQRNACSAGHVSTHFGLASNICLHVYSSPEHARKKERYSRTDTQ